MAQNIVKELHAGLLKDKKNFVPHCPEALRYAKVWGRDVVRSLTLAYAKRLFPDILRKRFFPAAKCFQVVHDVIKSRSQ